MTRARSSLRGPSPIDACSHRPPCPGCPRFGEPGLAATPAAKLDRLAKGAGLGGIPVFEAPADGYRQRARLAVRGRAASPKIGLFQTGTHRIADTPRCRVHHPEINAATSEVRAAIREARVRPYVDTAHSGALRYLQLVVEPASERVQIVLVGNGETPDVLGALPGTLERRMGSQLQGLFFNGQPEQTNTILGPHWAHLAGEANVREEIGGAEIFTPPGAFGQANPALFGRAVERIHSLVAPGSRVAECYAGVGAIGLGLLHRTASLHFNERNEHALAGLALGIAARPADERSRARVFPGAAGDRLDALISADVVIVDPPRRGLDDALRAELAASPPQRVIYLSCGIDALIADLDDLTSGGKLRIAGIEAYAFLPFTEHVETLVWLDRISG